MPQLAESWNYYTKRKTCAGCDSAVSLKYGVCTSCYKAPYGKEFQAVRTRGDKKKEFFGVELEIRGPDQHQHIEKLAELQLPANFSYDGGGTEIQFFPFGFKFYGRYRSKFEDYFKWLKSKRASWSAEHTGIHIHISRGSFSHDLHLFRFMKLIYQNKKEMIKLSQRDSSWGHYDPAADFKNNYSYSYSAPANKSLEDNLKERAVAWFNLKTREGYTNFGRKRDAVNICHTNTIEIRIFRSTSDCSEFMSYIQLCKALIEYSRTRDDWAGFCLFVKGNKKTFPDLTSQMKKFGLFSKERL